MREIKFRAWDTEMQSMEYDPYYHEFVCEGTPVNYMFRNPKPFIFMQFTGLHDKNGKEIYEGDIVSHGDWCNGDIKKRPLAVEFGELPDSDGYLASGYVCWKTGLSSLIDTCRKSEIIGNIYEHYHLLDN